MHTVGDLIDGVSGILTGTNLNNVTGLYRALQRAASILAQSADVPEMSGRMSTMLYDGVTDYEAPPTIFGTELVDIRPQGITRNPWDYATKTPLEQFDRTKNLLPNGYMATFEFDPAGNPILRIAQIVAKSKIILDSCSEITGWVAGGTASGLAVDPTVVYQTPGALRFNLAAGGTQGTITKTISTQNMSEYNGVGSIFVAVDLPSATAISSIAVKLGSGPANYVLGSNTEGVTGAFVADDYFLVPIDIATATTPAGAVDWNNISYLQVEVNYVSAVALPNMRVGYIFAALPAPHEILFQSSAIFVPAAGTVPQMKISSNDDSIILNEAAYTIYEHECAKAIALQNAGKAAAQTIANITNVLYGTPGDPDHPGLYAVYRGDNPSNTLRSVGSYYDNGDCYGSGLGGY